MYLCTYVGMYVCMYICLYVCIAMFLFGKWAICMTIRHSYLVEWLASSGYALSDVAKGKASNISIYIHDETDSEFYDMKVT